MTEEIKSLLERQNGDLQAFIATAGGQLGDLKSAIDKSAIRMNDLEAMLRKPVGNGSASGHATKSIGQRFIDGDEVKSWSGKGRTTRV